MFKLATRPVVCSTLIAMVGAMWLIPNAAADDDDRRGNPFSSLQQQLRVLQHTLKKRLDSIDEKLTTLETLSGQVQSIEGRLNAIDAKLQAVDSNVIALREEVGRLAVAGGLVPFKVQASGGLCDSAPSPSSNPRIRIEGDGSELFVVTSVLIKTAPQPGGQEGYTFLTLNSVRIDGTTFDTRTGNLVAPVDGFGVQESADLMGTSIRLSVPTPVGSPASPSQGGSFPLQIVADSEGGDDIDIQLFCRADDFDLSVDTVLVSGWKAPGDTVTVTYVPGN